MKEISVKIRFAPDDQAFDHYKGRAKEAELRDKIKEAILNHWQFLNDGEVDVVLLTTKKKKEKAS